MEFEERTDSVTIPKNTGLAGLLTTIRSLLGEIPRIKELRLTHAGVLYYTWYAPAGASERPPSVAFEDLRPYAVIRNCYVQEVVVPSQALLLFSLFAECQQDKLYPICLVVGSKSIFWHWLQTVTGVRVPEDSSIFGYAVISDPGVPDEALILCASYARSQQIEDTYRAYKALMEIPNG
jgi:hypothetical protein